MRYTVLILEYEIHWCNGAHCFEVPISCPSLLVKQSCKQNLATQLLVANKYLSNIIVHMLMALVLLGISQAEKENGLSLSPYISDTSLVDVTGLYVCYPSTKFPEHVFLTAPSPMMGTPLPLACYSISQIPHYTVFTKEKYTL